MTSNILGTVLSVTLPQFESSMTSYASFQIPIECCTYSHTVIDKSGMLWKIFFTTYHVINETTSFQSLRIKTTINTCHDREYFIYTGFSTRHREYFSNPGVWRNQSYTYRANKRLGHTMQTSCVLPDFFRINNSRLLIGAVAPL